MSKLSLIILDLHMPKLDGYSLLEIMHSDPELRRIPVIVLTSEKEAEVKSLQLGAADFITKPYEVPEVIQARVTHSIELADRRLDQLENQIADNDLEAAFETAHALKGMYANLSLDPLTKPVSEITEMLRNKTDADYSQLLAEAKKQFTALTSL
ncbi:MAG: response regulator [Lachnospiraceae bacterium]|nr:response regulator [Lachnospiraceae bacterium]